MVDFESDSDHSDNEKYNKLATAVSNLDSSQRVKPATRNEISSEVSEFHLAKTSSGRKNEVHLNELVDVLGHRATHAEIQKRVKEVTKSKKTLPKPLEKPAAERIKRIVGYEKAKKQLGRWDAYVQKNRMKDHIEFPLSDTRFRLQNSRQFFSKFKYETPLEKRMAAILSKGEEKEKEKEDEEEEYPLSLEEMMERRKEMARLRARQSYKEAKDQRQSKIKSKKYHRLQRREKIKEQLKEFEILQKTDPEAALQKLQLLDKTRAEERATLRHRNTSQWAKSLAVRAKYNVETRKVLSEQLSISKELTQKLKTDDSSEEEDGEPKTDIVTLGENPWAVEGNSEVADFVSGYRKFWEMKNNNKEIAKSEEPRNTARAMNKSEDPTSSITEIELNDNIDDKEVEEDKMLQEVSEVKSPAEPEKSDEDEADEMNDPSNLNEISAVSNMKDLSAKKSRSSKHSKKLEKQNQKVSKSASYSSEEDLSEENSDNAMYVAIFGASGAWRVIPDEVKSKKVEKKNKDLTGKSLDDLFDELEANIQVKLGTKLKTMKQALSVKSKEHTKDEDMSEDEDIDLSMKSYFRDTPRPELDVELGVSIPENKSVPKTSWSVTDINQPGTSKASNVSESTAEIDPNKYLKITPKHLKTQIPDLETGGDEGLDDDDAEEQRMTIMEAFGDDDVMAEFKDLKTEAEKSTELNTIDLTLPGWGEWGGKDVVPTKRKKRFLIKPNLPPRKDQNKEDMIINEEENSKIKQHMVQSIPFPFKNAEAFESSIRAPIGRDWIPETAHRALIKPSVTTKLGSIIEPVTEDELLNSTEKRSHFKGKVKENKI